ncbi:MAG: pentapeptide repeat-containing protein [Bacteroidetes bacterium]|nr:pentapeptide repeat-containing protein [Bacteroidota bacterium]
MTYCEDQSFEKIDFSAESGVRMEFERYEHCHFLDCDFNAANFSKIKFIDCRFEECNLSLVKLTDTSFQDVHFEQCKMLGLPFDHCNPFNFSVHFENCLLSQSLFYKVNLSKTTFQTCEMKEVDFTETDLSSATFNDCELQGAVFIQANLEKCDFRTSSNIQLDLDQNKVKSAQFDLGTLPNLLRKYQLKIKF